MSTAFNRIARRALQLEERRQMLPSNSRTSKRKSQIARAARQIVARSVLPRQIPRGFPTGVRMEFKCMDRENTCGVDATGVIALLNPTTQGTGFTNSIGRQFTIKSIELRGTATSTVATGTQQTARCLLVWDKQPNGALAAIADIGSTGGSGNWASGGR